MHRPPDLHDPLTGQHVTFTTTGQQSRGELLRAVVRLDPGGSVPKHAHLRQDERVEVVEGRVTITVGGRSRVLNIGDHADVAGRRMHVVRNETDSPAVFRLEVRPARRMETAMRLLFAVLRVGRPLARRQRT